MGTSGVPTAEVDGRWVWSETAEVVLILALCSRACRLHCSLGVVTLASVAELLRVPRKCALLRGIDEFLVGFGELPLPSAFGCGELTSLTPAFGCGEVPFGELDSALGIGGVSLLGSKLCCLPAKLPLLTSALRLPLPGYKLGLGEPLLSSAFCFGEKSFLGSTGGFGELDFLLLNCSCLDGAVLGLKLMCLELCRSSLRFS